MGNNQCGCGPKHVDNTDNRKSGKFSSGKKPKKKQRFNSVTTDIVEQEDMFFETEEQKSEKEYR
jgi:hypothetical protein